MSTVVEAAQAALAGEHACVFGLGAAGARLSGAAEDQALAALDVHRNAHQGKVGVLCLAPEEGMGVRAPEKRAKHVDAINRFRGV